MQDILNTEAKCVELVIVSMSYGEMVILVSVSCSTFFRLRPSFPMRRPTKLLWARTLRGTSSALKSKIPAHHTGPHAAYGQTSCSAMLDLFDTYVLVSLASWCMISRIILQAAEQPSGVEWMLIGFSAAPAFSLR